MTSIQSSCPRCATSCDIPEAAAEGSIHCLHCGVLYQPRTGQLVHRFPWIALGLALCGGLLVAGALAFNLSAAGLGYAVVALWAVALLGAVAALAGSLDLAVVLGGLVLSRPRAPLASAWLLTSLGLRVDLD